MKSIGRIPFQAGSEIRANLAKSKMANPKRKIGFETDSTNIF